MLISEAHAVLARQSRSGAGAGVARRSGLALLVVLAAAATVQLGSAYDAVDIPIRPPILPYVPRIRVPGGGSASVIMRPADLSIVLNDTDSLKFTTPRYLAPGVNDCGLQAPALILDAICSSFSVELTNQLPFQPFHTCPAGGDNISNGAKDFQWTNLHTHGLKVDPGASNTSNLCEPGYADAGLADPTITTQQYYCNDTVTSQQFCQVRGDNVLVIDRPLTNVTLTYNVRQHPAGATIKYTYPLEAVVPGVGWYHPHQHGSVGIQTPTSGAPLIIPESALPGGLWDLYQPNGGRNKHDCTRLVDVLKSMPLEESTIVQFYGIWFRNDSSNAPDDDTIPFLGLSSNPAAFPSSALLYNSADQPLYQNAAGRDWALVNGAFQPTIEITAHRYARWQLLNTMTMKWLDLTIQKVNADGSLTPVDTCKFWLLGRDGVPLPRVPRYLRSTPVGSPRSFNDVIMGPANRVDVLLKCDVPGQYVLASGAGPFHTNYNSCRATHCECFGDAPANGATLLSANNLYDGMELSAAVLAVIDVQPLPFGLRPQADFTRDEVCTSRLDRIYYLDYQTFPRDRTATQCFSFMNQRYGGFCSVNNQLFPDGVAYVEQGTQQIWNLRDITFHPFHLHETPVRLRSLPNCTTRVTNNWRVGDWADTILLPTCQTGCPWPAAGSGNGTCGDPVTRCDETTIQWLATDFSRPVQPRAKDLCACTGRPPVPPLPCQERVSVFHCHILPHEDEGCMALVLWTCPGGTTPPVSAFPAKCPTQYTLDCVNATRVIDRT